MDRSSAEIEREIEAERRELAGTVNELRDRISLESALHQVAGVVRDNGGDAARALGRQVRDNPVALALTGIGIAWLMMGPRQPLGSLARSRSSRDDQRGRGYGDSQSGYRGNRGWDDGQDWASGSGFLPEAEDDGWPRYDEARDRFAGEGRQDGGTSLRDRASAGLHAAADRLSGAAGRAGDAAGSAGHRLSDGAHRAWDGAQSAAKGLREHTEHLRANIGHGLDGMSEAARERVTAAREAAIAARERAGSLARQAGDRAAGFYEEAPLVTGALMLAAGALLGSLLPRTQTEDRLMGAESDRLMAEAQRIYDEEKARLQEVGEEIAETATEAGREIGETVSAALRSSGETAADAMREAGETAAKKMEQGKSTGTAGGSGSSGSGGGDAGSAGGATVPGSAGSGAKAGDNDRS